MRLFFIYLTSFSYFRPKRKLCKESDEEIEEESIGSMSEKDFDGEDLEVDFDDEKNDDFDEDEDDDDDEEMAAKLLAGEINLPGVSD